MTTETPRFNIEVRDEAGVRLIAVTGELDVATTPQLQEQLQEASAAEGAVLADLCGVDFMDSTGVRSLLEGHNSITGQGRRFAVSCVAEAAPQQILQMTGLDALIEHYPNRVTAINALRA